MSLKKIVVLFILLLVIPIQLHAKEEKDPILNRMALYYSMETLTQVPWYYLAAIDQYEKNIHKKKASTGDISITFQPEQWSGSLNPTPYAAQHRTVIEWFNGIGKDGNGDHIADRTNDQDILYTMASWIAQYGISKQDVKIAVWNFYQRELSVQTIMNTAKVFQTYGTIDLNQHMFPVPLYTDHSYRNTWGDARGFGGRRIHEGTDIFAHYGVPVRATSYGVIEVKGWNKFGGWRVGIRDINNTYHYFAHLNGFKKDLEIGQVVKPGDIIGSVGSSGYGPPGTSGKFPPHLHYGMYKDNGYSEWSFDPYPYLKRWERETRKLKK